MGNEGDTDPSLCNTYDSETEPPFAHLADMLACRAEAGHPCHSLMCDIDGVTRDWKGFAGLSNHVQEFKVTHGEPLWFTGSTHPVDLSHWLIKNDYWRLHPENFGETDSWMLP